MWRQQTAQRTIVPSLPELQKIEYEPNKDFGVLRSGGYQIEKLRKTKNN